MKYERSYIDLTGRMIEYLKDKKNSIVKEYLILTNKYINELRNIDALTLFDDLEYIKAFNEVLELVEETYRPNQFNSVIDGSLLRILDDEFIVYILGVKKQLKKPLKWKQLCELHYNFSVTKINYELKTHFKEDFTTFAIQQIKLSDLWKITKS